MAALSDVDARKRLGALITERRAHLRLSVNKAARRADISNKTWANIEAGGGARDVTYVGVEEALLWKPGSCSDVLAGGSPTIDDPSAPQPETEQPELIYSGPDGEDWRPVISRDLRDAVRDATMTTMPGMTAEKIQELEAKVEEALFRRLAERHRDAS